MSAECEEGVLGGNDGDLPGKTKIPVSLGSGLWWIRICPGIFTRIRKVVFYRS